MFFKIADVMFRLDTADYESDPALSGEELINKYLNGSLLDYLYDFNFSCNFTSPGSSAHEVYTIKLYRGSEYKYVKEGDYLTRASLYDVYKTADKIKLDYRQYVHAVKMTSCIYSSEISGDLKECRIYDYFDDDARCPDYYYLSLFVVIRHYIEAVLLLYNACIIHAVSLYYDNRSLIFTASSGVGKTTHANNWVKKYNAEILNGDTPIIKIIDNEPYLYGSPWCGSSNVAKNKILPLDYAVALKRGNINKIRKLTPFEAAAYIYGYIRYPVWDPVFTDLKLKLCDLIIKSRLRYYELECLPDEESAETAMKGIFETD